MLQPLQLEQVRNRFPRQLEELRDFLQKSGVVLDSPQSIAEIAGRLRSDRAFHRDLSSYVLALSFGRAEQFSYATLLGLLALAAAGNQWAADAPEQDAHDLLRFLMETQRSLNAEAPVAVTPASAKVTSDGGSPSASVASVAHGPSVHSPWWRRGIAAAACLLLAFSGLWTLLRHREPASAVPQQAVVPSNVPTPTASTPEPAVQQRRSGVRTPELTQRRGIQRLPPTSSAADAVRNEAPAIAASSIPSNVVPGTKDVVTSTTQSHVPPASVSSSRGQQVGVVPSAVLSRRLGSPSMPAYAADEEADNPAPHRPRLLRRSPARSAMAADTDLVAEMEMPANIAPASIANSASAPRGIVRPASLGMMAANVVYSPAPAYPPAASAAHVQGEVRVQATVDRDGNVAAARVISGPPLLRDAALDAVQQWRYRPYTSGGRAISTTALAVLDFELP